MAPHYLRHILIGVLLCLVKLNGYANENGIQAPVTAGDGASKATIATTISDPSPPSVSTHQPQMQTIAAAPPFSSYRILKSAPHNTHCFTQGFTINDDVFYESSGLYGKSVISRYPRHDHCQGALSQTTLIDAYYFAEGLTVIDNTIYLLTWKAGKLLRFDRQNLTPLGETTYRGQGWGLTHNHDFFIMSNGSHQLLLRDLHTFKIKKRLNVSWQNAWQKRLNELEFANNTIWANQWQKPIIFNIDPASGNVIHAYNFQSLQKKNGNNHSENVLNGIAYDKKHKAFWITGKNWPQKYLVQFLPVP